MTASFAPKVDEVLATKRTFFWHTDERTVKLFYKFSAGELDPHEFLKRLLLVKDAVEFSIQQDAASGLTACVLPDDEHAAFLGSG